MRFFIYWLILIDEKVNRCLGGRKHETLSARAGRKAHKHGWKQLGQFLDWIDPGHVDRAMRYHFKRRRKK